ncbi:hypothetical protein TNIN_271481 [Trichonephila inaurata madagascariensis]|uniref:Uncharacterized protein n=1 Tax=Trichonephila inaurata madagascariensis TaxID=2747483 RepID=A0A8X6YGX1_9ARAC|nr:hypothetical protein TNIN_271481 [Trichonephila inaurata madagascariensis]
MCSLCPLRKKQTKMVRFDSYVDTISYLEYASTCKNVIHCTGTSVDNDDKCQPHLLRGGATSSRARVSLFPASTRDKEWENLSLPFLTKTLLKRLPGRLNHLNNCFLACIFSGTSLVTDLCTLANNSLRRPANKLLIRTPPFPRCSFMGPDKPIPSRGTFSETVTATARR